MIDINGLPDELILSIGDYIEDSPQDLNALCRTCRRLYVILEPVLYISNATHGSSSAILWAVKHSQITTLEKAIARGGDPNEVIVENHQDYPLRTAAANGFATGIKLLLRHGVDYEYFPDLSGNAEPDEERNKYNPSILRLAATRGHESTVRVLIKEGVPLEDEQTQYESIFHICAETRLLAAMKDLFETGSFDINERCCRGRTPLHHAVLQEEGNEAKGVKEVIKWLLATGADIDALDNDKDTPVMLACETGTFQCANELIDAGASLLPHGLSGSLLHRCAHEKAFWHHLDMSCVSSNGQGPMPYLEQVQFDLACRLLAKGFEINFCRYDTDLCRPLETPLHTAAAEGILSTVACLLRLGADVSAAREDGITPLMSAVIHRRPGWQTPGEIALRKGKVLLLLNHGAALEQKDKVGRTALYWAFKDEDLEIINILFDKGASCNMINSENLNSLIEHLLTARNLGLVKTLLTQGATLDRQEYFRRPVRQAIHFHDTELVELLFSQSAKLDYLEDTTRQFWLDTALAAGRESLALHLHREGLWPQDGIHMAVERRRLELTRYLLATGYADINSQHREDKPPLYYALRTWGVHGKTNEYNAVAELSLDRGGRIDGPRACNDVTSSCPPICGAIFHDKSKCFSFFLEHEPSLMHFIDPRGDTCLHFACKTGSPAILEYILSEGLHIDAQRDDVEAPLIVALHRLSNMTHCEDYIFHNLKMIGVPCGDYFSHEVRELGARSNLLLPGAQCLRRTFLKDVNDYFHATLTDMEDLVAKIEAEELYLQEIPRLHQRMKKLRKKAKRVERLASENDMDNPAATREDEQQLIGAVTLMQKCVRNNTMLDPESRASTSLWALRHRWVDGDLGSDTEKSEELI